MQEIFTWELMQKRYFDPTFGGALIPGQRNVFATTADLTAYAFLVGPRSTSPVVSTLRASPIAGLGIQWQADYDPRLHAHRRQHHLGRLPLEDVLSDLGRQQRGAQQSAAHAVRQPVPRARRLRRRQPARAGTPAWTRFTTTAQPVLQYTTAQVTYNTNCCGLSVQYRRYNVGIRDESQYRVAFSVANIGTFGTLRKQDRLF